MLFDPNPPNFVTDNVIMSHWVLMLVPSKGYQFPKHLAKPCLCHGMYLRTPRCNRRVYEEPISDRRDYDEPTRERDDIRINRKSKISVVASTFLFPSNVVLFRAQYRLNFLR